MPARALWPWEARRFHIPAFAPEVETPCTRPGVDPEDWFPERSPGPRAVARLCEGCPVGVECLAFALGNEVSGVWGGKFFRTRYG